MRGLLYSEISIKEISLLYEALGIDINKKNIVSVVGGGGKTSTIYQLAKEFSDIGKKVIITTTTHMLKPKENIILEEDIQKVRDLLNQTKVITIGTPSGKEKIKGVSEKFLREVIDLVDILLVEADGAKGLPLKAPDKHEPAIFEGSSLVIGIAGIDSLGKAIKETCHRPNLVADLLQENEEHIIESIDIAKILCSSGGQRKNVNCEYKVLINKADCKNAVKGAIKVSKEVVKLGIENVIITTFK